MEAVEDAVAGEVGRARAFVLFGEPLLTPDAYRLVTSWTAPSVESGPVVVASVSWKICGSATNENTRRYC